MVHSHLTCFEGKTFLTSGNEFKVSPDMFTTETEQGSVKQPRVCECHDEQL